MQRCGMCGSTDVYVMHPLWPCRRYLLPLSARHPQSLSIEGIAMLDPLSLRDYGAIVRQAGAGAPVTIDVALLNA